MPAFDQPVIAVMDHVTGPDNNDAINDMAHTARFAAENGGRRYRCTLTVSNPGNDTARGQRAAMRCLMAWRRTRL